MTFWLAVSGSTVAFSCSVAFTVSVLEAGERVTLVTSSSTLMTMLLLAPFLSLAVAVMVAEPADSAFTLPCSSTVATALLEEVKITPLSVALSGETAAVTLMAPPTFRVVSPADR